MPETPRMSEMHKAVADLGRTVEHHGSDQDSANLEFIEKHGRELYLLLTAIIAHSDLSQLPSTDLQQLSDLGVIQHDASHDAHTSALTTLLGDLSEPQNQHVFFRKYHAIFPAIAGHDKIATELISSLLLWQVGHIRRDTLENAITTYLEQAPLYLIKERL